MKNTTSLPHFNTAPVFNQQDWLMRAEIQISHKSCLFCMLVWQGKGHMASNNNSVYFHHNFSTFFSAKVMNWWVASPQSMFGKGKGNSISACFHCCTFWADFSAKVDALVGSSQSWSIIQLLFNAKGKCDGQGQYGWTLEGVPGIPVIREYQIWWNVGGLIW